LQHEFLLGTVGHAVDIRTALQGCCKAIGLE
jgi:hypothetical protein